LCAKYENRDSREDIYIVEREELLVGMKDIVHIRNEFDVNCGRCFCENIGRKIGTESKLYFARMIG
jgi:hypothetical protein